MQLRQPCQTRFRVGRRRAQLVEEPHVARQARDDAPGPEGAGESSELRAELVKQGRHARFVGGPTRYFRLAAFALLASCQSVAVISTDPPGTEIYSGEKRLGKTPFELKVEALPKPEAGGFLLQLRSPGHSRVWLWIPEGIRGLDLAFNLAPFAVNKEGNESKLKSSASRVVINRVTARLLAVQSGLLQGDAAVGADLEKLKSEYPDVGSVYFLEAIASLNKSNKSAARESLDRAIFLSPKEYDFLTLYNLVREETPK